MGWKSDNTDEGFHYTFQDCIIKGYTFQDVIQVYSIIQLAVRIIDEIHDGVIFFYDQIIQLVSHRNIMFLLSIT